MLAAADRRDDDGMRRDWALIILIALAVALAVFWWGPAAPWD